MPIPCDAKSIVRSFSIFLFQSSDMGCVTMHE